MLWEKNQRKTPRCNLYEGRSFHHTRFLRKTLSQCFGQKVRPLCMRGLRCIRILEIAFWPASARTLPAGSWARTSFLETFETLPPALLIWSTIDLESFFCIGVTTTSTFKDGFLSLNWSTSARRRWSSLSVEAMCIC